MGVEDYIGRQIKKNFKEIAEPILEKGKAQFNYIADYEISVILLDKTYKEWDETFELSCYLIISLEDDQITDIKYENRVWGGDGLGDVNVGEICTSTEMKRMERTERELLKAIVEK